MLQPEWRGHLDQYVAEIDTLIWLDMTVRAECMTPRPTYEQYMKVTVMECAVRNETIP